MGRRVAAIDIGTNSVLLVVAEAADDGALVAIVERATITRLGAGVDATRTLASDAIARTLACLEDYAGTLAKYTVSAVDVVGTSAMRDARGGDDFIARAEAILGVRPRTISGDEEAVLTFEGALSGLSTAGPTVVFDVGGGSTEMIYGTVDDAGPRTAFARSLDVGSVRLTERHVRTDPPTSEEVARIRSDVRAALDTLDAPPPDATLVGVAGTVTTLAAVHAELATYDAGAVHGVRLGRAVVAALVDELARLPVEARRALHGLHPRRADVIVAGALVVDEVMRFAGTESLVVSDRGVRWGLVARLVGDG